MLFLSLFAAFVAIFVACFVYTSTRTPSGRPTLRSSSGSPQPAAAAGREKAPGVMDAEGAQ